MVQDVVLLEAAAHSCWLTAVLGVSAGVGTLKAWRRLVDEA